MELLYQLTETTECDFKRELEVRKPKSWLKSVSAFANGIGGKLIFGIDDAHNIVGLSNAQEAVEKIMSETSKLPGYTDALMPEFYSDGTSFRIVLKR